ncbi:MAG: DUF2846 domain-containing protein [Desulfobacterales bacterium]|jgi:hypothetical protein|nr:DUF2846 domain-containing protein [Desulfobacterales bacterium]
MKPLIAACAAALLIACAHGKTADFPRFAADPAEAAQVYIIRNNQLFGWGLTVEATLNGAAIARLRSGEHIRFLVPPGLYQIGISESIVSVALEKGRNYYFLISVDDTPSGFEIERIDTARGEEWLMKTRPLP